MMPVSQSNGGRGSSFRIPVPEIAAFADGIVIIAALLNMPLAIFQGVALCIKLLLLLAFARRNSALRGAFSSLVAFSAAALLSTAYGPYGSFEGLTRTSVVLIHIASTAGLLCAYNAERYTRAFAIFVVSSNVIFLIMMLRGQIEDLWGRFTYFSGMHPNLGSEISAMGAICACVSFRLSIGSVSLMAAVNFGAAMAMQGRAAMLTILIAYLARLAIHLNDRFQRSRLILAGFALFFVPILVFVLYQSIGGGVSQAFLLDDDSRGVGTGFVGRDTRWAAGIYMFSISPIVGGGPDAFEIARVPTPHNFFFYGIGEFGILFFIVLFAIGVSVYRGFTYNPQHMLVLSSILVLIVFNDRFLNLNSYPAVAYILIFAFGSWAIKRDLRKSMASAGLRKPFSRRALTQLLAARPSVQQARPPSD